MVDDVHARVAVLEDRDAARAKAMEQMAADIRQIRDMVAFGRGAWWVGILILGGLSAVAGGAGALVHWFVCGH